MVLALPLLLAPRGAPGTACRTAILCGGGRPGAPRRGEAPAPWLPVHPERQARMVGVPVFGVCTDGTPPRKLAGAPPQLLPESSFRRHGGVLLAHCLIDREGYVVQAQVLKAPDQADQAAVVRALAGWRFTPAQHAGQAVAVHFLVSIPVARDP